MTTKLDNCLHFGTKATLARPRALSGCDLKSGASAVPGRGFADCVRAVRKLARPTTTQVCQELAARVADGVTSVGAAMKRGTGLSQGREVSGESRGRAPEGERVSPKERAPRPRPAATLGLRGAVSQYAPFGAPPPFGEARSCKALANLGAQTKSAAREPDFISSAPVQTGEGDHAKRGGGGV